MGAFIEPLAYIVVVAVSASAIGAYFLDGIRAWNRGGSPLISAWYGAMLLGLLSLAGTTIFAAVVSSKYAAM